MLDHYNCGKNIRKMDNKVFMIYNTICYVKISVRNNVLLMDSE